MNKRVDALLRNVEKQADALSKRWSSRSESVRRSVYLALFIWSFIFCFGCLIFMAWYGFFFFLILSGVTGYLYDKS